MSYNKPDVTIYRSEHTERWCVKRKDMQRPSFSFDTRSEAEEKGRHLAKTLKSKLRVQDDTGDLAKKVSFKKRAGSRRYHVEKSGKEWVVRAEDRTYAKHRFRRKSDAIRRAQKEASDHSSVMVVHNSDGGVQRIQDLRGIPAPSSD